MNKKSINIFTILDYTSKSCCVKTIPAAAAAIPPTLLTMKYWQAFAISRRPTIFTKSTAKVENVVNDPQNPTPQRSFILGVIPNVLRIELGLTPAPGFMDLVSMRGEPNIPPRAKEPRTLIPAVCQPIK
mmetsp:Transcript_32591/g.38982  ORF Transcript_32591/g.38982 Transcript_32591/m.38982 type:complete len:129 (-) Transcript_32591:175-561(-)